MFESGATSGGRHGQPEKSPHELHIASIAPATKIPVMNGTDRAAPRRPFQGGENCNVWDAVGIRWGKNDGW